MTTKGEKRPGPTLKAPHNRTIRVFDRAVLYARFELLKLILLLEAREKSWTQASLRGKSDPIPFNLTLSHIATEFECDRASLSRQFASLVKAKVFLETDDPDFYLINKKPLTWIDGKTGKPLFVGHKRERILQLEEEAKVYSRVGPSPRAVKLQPTEAVGPSPQAPTSGVGSSLQSSLTTVGPSPQAVKLQPTAKSSPPVPPLERAQEDSVKESKKEETETRAGDVLNLDDEEPFNAPVPPMPKVEAPAINNDAAEVAKVAAFADECFPMSDFGIQVRQHARFYPIAWLKRAIETAAGKRRASWPYVMGIVRGIEEEGGLQQRTFAANPAMAKKPDVSPLPPVVSYPRKTSGAALTPIPPVVSGYARKNPPGTAERLRREKADAERKRLESGSSAEPEVGKGEPPRPDPGSLF